jgi:hypothetical protein
MDRTAIWQDINDAVDQALDERLHLLDLTDLVRRSDALVARLPRMSNMPTTTVGLLRRYHSQLQQELCQGNRPRMHFEHLEDQLRELTRAIVATITADNGLPIENAVLLALILHSRGIDSLCATPAPTTNV